MRWENDFGELFESEEEARNNALEAMELDDYCDFLPLGRKELLEIVLNRCPHLISDALEKAEDVYFNFYYREVYDEDEEEEEG